MASTPLLGLSLPADGTTNWGTLVNTSITALIDSAVAGTTTLSSDADVTLTATTEATNQARQAVLLCSGARTAIRTITAPASSKTYIVINNTSGGYGVKIVGAGPTVGITVPSGRAYQVAWNGSDFVTTSTTTINLATEVSGTLPIANGGTGATTVPGLLLGNGTSAVTTVTAPSGAVVGTTDTQTLTNKRITSRVASIASASTITPTGDTADQYNVTALAVPATVAAPSGTPTDGQKLIIRIKDDGTARALTWTTSSGAYRAIGLTLPPTTVINKNVYIGCIYNSTDIFWDVVAVAQQT